MKQLVAVLTLILSTGAFAQGKAPQAGKAEKAPAAATQKPAGSVDWSGQVLKATGSGAPDMKATSPAQARLGAETAAKLDAFRNLLSQAKGVQISAGKTVGDEMAKDEIRARVEGLIRGYRIAAKRYFSDGGVEMDVEVPLSALAEVFVPQDTRIAVKSEGEKKNTGLVIDARGLKVTPALAPRVLDDKGTALYAASVLSDEARQKQSAAAYFASLEEARKSTLVGEKPLVIKALRAEGSDLVLEGSEAKKLSEINTAFLTEGRVAIVTN